MRRKKKKTLECVWKTLKNLAPPTLQAHNAFDSLPKWRALICYLVVKTSSVWCLATNTSKWVCPFRLSYGSEGIWCSYPNFRVWSLLSHDTPQAHNMRSNDHCCSHFGWILVSNVQFAFGLLEKNWFMLSVRISSYGCTQEVWRARKKRKSCSRREPRATLASWGLSKLPKCIHDLDAKTCFICDWLQSSHNTRTRHNQLSRDFVHDGSIGGGSKTQVTGHCFTNTETTLTLGLSTKLRQCFRPKYYTKTVFRLKVSIGKKLGLFQYW